MRTPPPTRGSLKSVYDLLADLDEHQLALLLSEMNHTTSQNIAVSQAVDVIDHSEDPSFSLAQARLRPQAPRMERSVSRSQRLRLSLKTMFRNGHAGHSLSVPAAQRTVPSPSYKRVSRPFLTLPSDFTVHDLEALLSSDMFESSSSYSAPSPVSTRSTSSLCPASPMTPTPGSRGRIRRHPSTMDMALEAERAAEGTENTALAMFEPRPLTPSPLSRTASSSHSVSALSRQRTQQAPPVVLEGIFEIMEST